MLTGITIVALPREYSGPGAPVMTIGVLVLIVVIFIAAYSRRKRLLRGHAPRLALVGLTAAARCAWPRRYPLVLLADLVFTCLPDRYPRDGLRAVSEAALALPVAVGDEDSREGVQHLRVRL